MVIRKYMVLEASQFAAGCWDEGNNDGFEGMMSLMKSLSKGSTIAQDVCMLVYLLCDAAVNVLQYSPGEHGVHATRYGGKSRHFVHGCRQTLHVTVGTWHC